MTDARTQVREIVETTYRSDSRRVLATLVRLLHDFDLAEEALHGPPARVSVDVQRAKDDERSRERAP